MNMILKQAKMMFRFVRGYDYEKDRMGLQNFLGTWTAAHMLAGHSPSVCSQSRLSATLLPFDMVIFFPQPKGNSQRPCRPRAANKIAHRIASDAKPCNPHNTVFEKGKKSRDTSETVNWIGSSICKLGPLPISFVISVLCI